MLARLRSLARMVFRRSAYEEELREELEFHLEQRAGHLADAGLERHEALRRARVEFGGVERAKERCREARGGRWIDELSRNVAYAVRSVRRNPGFSAVAVLSLALGIGANLAVFSVLHRLVLAKLPVRDADTLYQLVMDYPGFGKRYAIPYPRFELVRDNIKIFSTLFGWGGWTYDLTVGDQQQKALITAVTGNYFETLGVRPALGRLLSSQDEQARASQIAVIGYGLWQTTFGGDPAVVGRSIKVADATFAIVGVTPPQFNGTEPGAVPAVYLLLHGYERVMPNAIKGAGANWLHVWGRLAADVPLATAQAVLREQWPRLEKAFPLQSNIGNRNSPYPMMLEDGGHGYSAVRQEYSQAIVVLMGLVAAVFLIACANLATLLFVRGAGRLREMSIRFALGASRAHLVRQWMMECLLLSVLGGVAGLIAARWITDLLLYFVAEADRPGLRYQTEPGVVVLGVALTVAATFLCGLVPGLRATSARPEQTFRAQSGAVTPPRGFAAQGILAGQLAASLVLVVGAILFSRTMWNLNNASGGFDRKAVVYAIPDFGAAHIPRNRQDDLVKDALDRLNRSPLVAAASMGSPPMVWGNAGWGSVIGVTGYVLAPDEDNTVWYNGAFSGYFDVLGIPIVAGRDFEERDRPAGDAPATAIIVNETLARHYFGARNAVGETVTMRTPREIIGVVSDTKNVNLRDAGKDVAYLPISAGGWSALLVRPKTGIAHEAVEAEIRSAFAAVSKQITVEVAPLERAVQRSMNRDRLIAQLSAAFGILGILLASIGLYAAIAHSVSSRTREIGIRIAIGAKARDVIWMVLSESLRVTTAGLLIGLPAAIAGSRLIGSLLFGVSPSDPPTLAVSAAVLALTGALAAWWPARRATRLDPSSTLRCE
jgi:putative ABC transport system permease protein